MEDEVEEDGSATPCRCTGFHVWGIIFEVLTGRRGEGIAAAFFVQE